MANTAERIEALKASNPVNTRGNAVIWPSKPCSRCGGCGRYSFNLMHGDTCYGCSGSGLQVLNKKVAEIRAEYLEAVRKQTRPLTSDLKVGDRLAVYNADASKRSSWAGEAGTPAVEGISGNLPKDVEYVTLTSVEVIEGTEDHNQGRSTSSNTQFDPVTRETVKIVKTWYCGWVTFTYEYNGEQRKVETGTNNILCRSNTIDREPFVQRAWEAAAKSRVSR